MAFPDFDSCLADYKDQLRKAGVGATHDYRRQIFIEFLRCAFDVDVSEIKLEEKLKVAEVRGFIDALFGSLILEFKKHLDRERADGLSELKRYFKAHPKSVYALLTEGWVFEVYTPDGDELRRVDRIEIDKVSSRAAHRFFDIYLFAETNKAPDSEDVVARFGGLSPLYRTVAQRLAGAWKQLESDSPTQIKFSEWNRLLAKVYGSAVGNEDLFLRHTYLSVIARPLRRQRSSQTRPAHQQYWKAWSPGRFSSPKAMTIWRKRISSPGLYPRQSVRTCWICWIRWSRLSPSTISPKSTKICSRSFTSTW